MMESIELGPVPCNEECAQAGQENYSDRARVEGHAFIHQIRRVVGPEPGSARLSVKSFPHDFGSYFEVICKYSDADQAAVEYAWSLDGHKDLANWDAEARRELGLPPLAAAENEVAADQEALLAIEANAV